MASEIERKFLVKGEFKSKAFHFTSIKQGYISSDPSRAVRVRIEDEKGYLTIKGKSDNSGLERYEWEREIPVEEAFELIKLCESGLIIKTRYYIREGRSLFEVDEFEGDNRGLVIAEIELSSADQEIDLPEWIGAEVTGDPRYYNSYLVRNPYSGW
ncbi:MAG: CYTH domain-containing protein [Bacteroidales bacterium]|nr:CYTH domain-containing protein [Bacteroidales bacterium]MDD2425656.1 CYTH domain-containing protein [Bacteroidales bacterium]MDD3990208.1 CYTH domain-containing protein [Bacteroidales bacterium]MDD4638722.1 CYTH domain-containing protein [Bacteroidales bacterium]